MVEIKKNQKKKEIENPSNRNFTKTPESVKLKSGSIFFGAILVLLSGLFFYWAVKLCIEDSFAFFPWMFLSYGLFYCGCWIAGKRGVDLQ